MTRASPARQPQPSTLGRLLVGLPLTERDQRPHDLARREPVPARRLKTLMGGHRALTLDAVAVRSNQPRQRLGEGMRPRSVRRKAPQALSLTTLGSIATEELHSSPRMLRTRRPHNPTLHSSARYASERIPTREATGGTRVSGCLVGRFDAVTQTTPVERSRKPRLAEVVVLAAWAASAQLPRRRPTRARRTLAGCAAPAAARPRAPSLVDSQEGHACRRIRGYVAGRPIGPPGPRRS
jgi:hypothetical protein